MKKNEFCPFASFFVYGMIAIGIVAMGFAPVGQSVVQDKIHYLTSFFYMFGHLFIIFYFNISPLHSFGFAFSFLFFMMKTLRLRKLKDTYNFHHPANISNDAVVARIAKLSANQRLHLTRCMFLEMIFEYAMFLAFITGIDSGLSPSFRPC
mmetsp:Transcript_19509/g.25270  ORF Transcript_19509/g.25270 Transcript_19509/m.25270 type:complete len:151 (+) Transcript_19509:303-755(+)